MASNRQKVPSELESVKVERDYWKESYNILYVKFQRLASCHTCVKVITQPAKQARTEEEDDKSMDPLKLPEPCVRSILSYLSGKEICKMMEVSKSWKQNVEVRKYVMNRALNEVIVTPSIKDFSFPMINRHLDSPLQRGYKHMKSSLTLLHQFTITKAIHPIETHASTLESLTIADDKSDNLNGTDYRMKACVFPVLRKLNIVFTRTNFLQICSFPMLTHLKIGTGNQFLTRDELINNFKNLETFHGHVYPDPEYMRAFLNNFERLQEIIDEENNADITEADTSTETKLKHLHYNGVNKKVMRFYQNSLVKVEISSATYEEFFWYIQHFKVLKSLTISYLAIDQIRDQNLNYVQNDSIEDFKTSGIFDLLDIELELGDYENSRNAFQQIILSLPSLRNLVLRRDPLIGEIIQMLASNMLHLKKVTCKEINEQLRLAHEEIKNNPNGYINSTFELIADPLYSFDEIENEFI